MKKLKRVLSLVLSAVAAFSLAACGGGNAGIDDDVTSIDNSANGGIGATGHLNITFFEGGYGRQWLVNALDRFCAKKNGLATYELKADPNTTSTATTQMKSGKNIADIYMVQSGAWPEWVSRGYLENLDAVYDGKIQTSKGETTVREYMQDDFVDQYRMQRIYGQGQASAWVMPWAMTQIGIVYNEDILLKTKHTTAKAGAWKVGDTWTAPPESMADMLAYCADLNAVNITPIVFPGAGSHWLRYFIQVWWAQYQGVYEENTANVAADAGCFYDFWNFGDENVWNQEGIKVGIDTLQSLLIDTNKGEYKNVSKDVASYSVQDSEREFVLGNAAMLFGGSFMYNEITDFIDQNNDGVDDISFKMMNIPYIDNALKNENGEVETINYYYTEEFMFIPKGANDKALAKEFLIYLSSEECVAEFAKYTGTLRPFECNPQEVYGDTVEFNQFTRSVFDIYDNTDIHLVTGPAGVPPEERSIISIYKGTTLHLNGSMPWATFAANLKTMNSTTLMAEVQKLTKTDYQKWIKEYGG